MSHSKRNTSRAVFTSHERLLAKSAWNSTSARLSRDSFLPFASCRLCLLPARDPVSCSHGDIFCRECALENILAQKKDIKRLEKVKEEQDKEEDEEVRRAEEETKQRAVQEFEKIQIGLEAETRVSLSIKSIVDREIGEISVEKDVEWKRGEKRKFVLDENELLQIARDDRSKARKAIDDEKVSKTTLPSFWVPSITPMSNTKSALHTIVKKAKASPVCPASPSRKPHFYSLQGLVAVAFTEEKDATTGRSQRICPSCKKVLSNTSKAILAKPCGHVLCKSCVGKFMTPTGVYDPHAPDVNQNLNLCYVCEADITERASKGEPSVKDDIKGRIRPGLVEIKSEGTGFSGAGQNTVAMSGVAFQC